jgi:hypothetical protein
MGNCTKQKWRSHLMPSARSLALLLALTSSAFAGKMTFELKSTGGNLIGSEWIAAEGEIAADSATDLENYLNVHRNFAKDKIGYNVNLNSPGGSLIGGIKLGEFFRKHQFTTNVAKTVPDGAHSQPAPGICASACAIAFIGGVERYANGGELGVHQFYQEISLKNPSEKMFNALDLSNEQMVGAILIDYAFRMGVDPRFIAMASSTPPNQMHFFDKEELESLKINWRPKDFEPWAIEPSGQGVVAFTKSKDKTQTAVLFCRSDRMPRLFIKPDSNDFDWYKQAMNHVEDMSAFGITIPRSGIILKTTNGGPILELMLPSFDARRISGAKSIDVGVNGPRYLWTGFSFNLPTHNAVPTMLVALKNCI